MRLLRSFQMFHRVIMPTAAAFLLCSFGIELMKAFHQV
uniref:Uncharacterized protein n=1 Tax=Arundo donax TaxID=35708 RepID=A0A0A9BNQ1_ARUDO